eukprot:315907_1
MSLSCSGGGAWGSSCQYLVLNANMNENANTDILCQDYDGCDSANLNIIGMEANNNGNVTISCSGSYGCDDTKFNISYMNYIYMNCADCASGTSVFASTSKYLDINCDRSCYMNTIHCPTYSLSVCSIKCSDYSSSCREMDIWNDNGDNNNYLSLECPINPINTPNMCDNIEFKCSEQITSLIYNYTDGSQTCSSNNCCPWGSTNTQPATTSMQSITTTYGQSTNTIATTIVSDTETTIRKSPTDSNDESSGANEKMNLFMLMTFAIITFLFD